MSKVKLLQQIRESESRNAASLEQVASDRQAALRQAQQDRTTLVEKARVAAEKKAARDLEKARKEIAMRKQALLKEGLHLFTEMGIQWGVCSCLRILS